MSAVAFLGLLLLKHALLAHVVDFGYSLGRSTNHRWWWFGILSQSSAELVASIFILQQWTWDEATLALSLEAVALVASSLVERGAPLRRLLLVHVGCELSVMAVYIAIAWRLTVS